MRIDAFAWWNPPEDCLNNVITMRLNLGWTKFRQININKQIIIANYVEDSSMKWGLKIVPEFSARSASSTPRHHTDTRSPTLLLWWPPTQFGFNEFPTSNIHLIFQGKPYEDINRFRIFVVILEDENHKAQQQQHVWIMSRKMIITVSFLSFVVDVVVVAMVRVMRSFRLLKSMTPSE